MFWKADMDIDCDGQVTGKCNGNADPWFQDDTAFHQSDGKPLRAESLPYVVVPSTSSIWKYTSYGIKGGGVVAVIYNNKVEYAVVGDTGPRRSSARRRTPRPRPSASTPTLPRAGPTPA